MNSVTSPIQQPVLLTTQLNTKSATFLNDIANSDAIKNLQFIYGIESGVFNNLLKDLLQFIISENINNNNSNIDTPDPAVTVIGPIDMTVDTNSAEKLETIREQIKDALTQKLALGNYQFYSYDPIKESTSLMNSYDPIKESTPLMNSFNLISNVDNRLDNILHNTNNNFVLRNYTKFNNIVPDTSGDDILNIYSYGINKALPQIILDANDSNNSAISNLKILRVDGKNSKTENDLLNNFLLKLDTTTDVNQKTEEIKFFTDSFNKNVFSGQKNFSDEIDGNITKIYSNKQYDSDGHFQEYAANSSINAHFNFPEENNLNAVYRENFTYSNSVMDNIAHIVNESIQKLDGANQNELQVKVHLSSSDLVTVDVKLHNNTINVNIDTNNSNTGQVISQNIDTLKQNLHMNNFNLGTVTVSTASSFNNSNDAYKKNNGQQNNEQMYVQKTNTPKINVPKIRNIEIIV